MSPVRSVLLCSVLFFCFSAVAAALEVRVGIYDNPPLVFQNEAGEEQGLYPDLLQAVAKAEGWSLTYVAGSFTEGLERLRSGDIDLMTAIALREDRLAYADFSQRTVLLLWSEVLSRPENDIHGLVELHARRVAVAKGGNNYEEFAKLCKQFHLEPDFVEVDDFVAVTQAVADGHADAGVVSKQFAATMRKKFGLVSTGIIFNPFSVSFAAPKGLANGLLEVIDRHLYTWQNDNNSVYYQSLNRWLDIDGKAHSSQPPPWLYPLGFALLGSLLAILAWVFTLRRKVRQATTLIAGREQLALSQKNSLQQIIDNMPIGIWLSDADGVLQLENPAGEKIWGRKGLPDLGHYDEMRGWWADSGEQIKEEEWGLARVLRHGELCLDERIEIETIDGQRKIILASAVPLHDAEGNMTGGLEIEQDITEQRRAEQAISDLARKWQETFDSVGDAIAILDLEYRVVQCNRSFAAMVDRDSSAIIGQNCCHLVHGPDGQLENCSFMQMLKTGRAESVTFRVAGRWWAVRTDPMYNAAGDMVGAIHIHSDITASKEFESLLNDERQALEMVATGAPLVDVLGQICHNIEGHILGALCSILLVDDDGLHLHHGAAPNLSEAYCQAVGGTAIGPEAGSCGTAAFRREMVIVEDIATDPLWKKASKLALDEGLRACWSLPVLDGDGEPIATLATYFREPRKPRSDELELARRQAYLVRVALEKHKGEQEALDLLQLLEERNSELERFAYTVSHDLKTPLVTIGGFIGQLRQDIESGDQECVAIDLDFIESSVKTMGGLLANLLHLARAGRAISEQKTLQMGHVAEVALGFAKGVVGEIPVRCEFADDLPPVSGDAERLREALQNLIENAAKFCAVVPHPEIGIGCQLDGGDVVCWVSDNGIGILPQYHEKIFHIFEKLDAESSGSGIGLAVSRRIVEKHGGRLWVESEGNSKGSVFFLSLPVAAG